MEEAGNNCERGQEPLKDGMRMSRVAECYYHRQTNPRFNWNLSTSTDEPVDLEQGSGSPGLRETILLLVLTVIIL